MSGFAVRVRPSVDAVTSEGPSDLLRNIAERGPDRQVAVAIGRVEIAHAAFHVTPEAEREHFPVRHPTRDMWVVADARLDYRDELLADLRAAGCSFEPDTDADFILAAHEVWGDEAQAHLTGDFAYVVGDDGKVLAGRAVLTGKPLFWATSGDNVLIASSVRCVLDAVNAIRPPDEEFVAEILCESLSRDDHTPYEGINRLPPGWRLRCAPGIGAVAEQVDSVEIGTVLDVDVDEAAALVRAALESAIAERIRGREDVACELSGGFDSSTIVGLVADARPKRRPVTVSNMYPGQDCDETAYIDAVVDATDAVSHRLDAMAVEPIDLAAASAVLRDIVGYPDPSRELWSMAASANCRIMLTGQGGDEAFWHTNLYACDILADQGVLPFVRHCREQETLRDGRSRIRMVLARNLLLKTPRISSVTESLLRKRRTRSLSWLTPAMRSTLRPRASTKPAFDAPSAWNRAARHELITHPMSTWAYELMDRASVGLVDLRHPFCDRRFVELILRLPGHAIHPDARERHLHRHAFGDVLPSVVRDRTDQAEFSVIYLRSLMKNAPGGLEGLTTHRRGWTAEAPLTSWHDQFLSSGETEHLYPIWRAMCVSAWLDGVFHATAVERIPGWSSARGPAVADQAGM